MHLYTQLYVVNQSHTGLANSCTQSTQDNHAAGCSANVMLEGVRNKLSMLTLKWALRDLWLFSGALQEFFDPVVSTFL